MLIFLPEGVEKQQQTNKRQQLNLIYPMSVKQKYGVNNGVQRTSGITSGTGALNTNCLQKELVMALAEDRAYHITDEAKKKHISTAASYDEFRHFVACADQKRVRCESFDCLANISTSVTSPHCSCHRSVVEKKWNR